MAGMGKLSAFLGILSRPQQISFQQNHPGLIFPQPLKVFDTNFLFFGKKFLPPVSLKTFFRTKAEDLFFPETRFIKPERRFSKTGFRTIYKPHCFSSFQKRFIFPKKSRVPPRVIQGKSVPNFSKRNPPESPRAFCSGFFG